MIGSLRRRRLVVLSTAVLTLTLVLATTGLTVAGCGWPNCNPAQLSSTYSETRSPSGVAGTIRVHQQTTVYYPTAETWVKFYGSSYAKWYGSTPFNASLIVLTDQLHTDGIAVSISLPPGFSGGGTDGSYTTQVSNNWQISHSFSNIYFSCFVCYGVRHTASATFTFGSKNYTIQTHDDSLV